MNQQHLLGVPARITERREATGLNVSECARRMGVPRSCLAAWEDGRTFPSLKGLDAFATVTKTRLRYLVRGEGRP